MNTIVPVSETIEAPSGSSRGPVPYLSSQLSVLNLLMHSLKLSSQYGISTS